MNIFSLIAILLAIFMIIMPILTIFIDRQSQSWQNVHEWLFGLLSILIGLSWIAVLASWLAAAETTDYRQMDEADRLAIVVTIVVVVYNLYAFGCFKLADIIKASDLRRQAEQRYL